MTIEVHNNSSISSNLNSSIRGTNINVCPFKEYSQHITIQGSSFTSHLFRIDTASSAKAIFFFIVWFTDPPTLFSAN